MLMLHISNVPFPSNLLPSLDAWRFPHLQFCFELQSHIFGLVSGCEDEQSCNFCGLLLPKVSGSVKGLVQRSSKQYKCLSGKAWSRQTL